MNYNTERRPLRYTEYGRIVQKLIDHACTLEDREERNKAARYIVEVMGMLSNPGLKGNEEFKHKLWDHLIIMSDFKLDVDTPYPPPSPQDASYQRPDPVPYPGNNIKNPTYGKHLERFIEKGLKEEDPAKLKAYAEMAAYYMKLVYLNWSKENINDDTIRNDLRRMSGGVYNLDENFNLENVKGSTQHAGSSFVVKKQKKQRFQQQSRNYKGKGGQGQGQGGGGRFFKRK